MIEYSKALRESKYGLLNLFYFDTFELYSGPVPCVDHDAGRLLVTIPDCVLKLNHADGTFKIKDSPWVGPVTASGRVTHFRYFRVDDRSLYLQGTVGEIDSDLVLRDCNLFEGAQFYLSWFVLNVVES